ncbi:hypothetical protein J6590_001705 [Homalodisca vitripennis]|nr:hypothetical protein J6590_001705 [Homalodisca vitripennis]
MNIEWYVSLSPASSESVAVSSFFQTEPCSSYSSYKGAKAACQRPSISGKTDRQTDVGRGRRLPPQALTAGFIESVQRTLTEPKKI